MTSTVAIVHLGRPRGMGEARRVASWRAILEAAGKAVVDVPLLARHRVGRRLPAPSQPLAVIRGAAVAESLAWSLPSLNAALAGLDPDAVICVTARAWHPRLSHAAPAVILDYVDRLSVSYRDRAAVGTTRSRGIALRLLATRHERVERGIPGGVAVTAAGWEDARHLAAEWVPNVVRPGPVVDERHDRDVLFLGNLSYLPNVSALELLARVWPAVLRARPGTTALVAGARPAPRVRQLAREHGWDLEPDFADIAPVCGRARVAVAPLVHVAGIQNKVLEAAAHGVPQVVTPEALSGLHPGFPADVSTEDTFADSVVTLLGDEVRRRDLAAAAREHIVSSYSPAAWARRWDALSRRP